MSEVYNPCLECRIRYGHDYSEKCDGECTYAMAVAELKRVKGEKNEQRHID